MSSLFLLVLSVAASISRATSSGDIIPGFAPSVAGIYAANADLLPASNVSGAAECAARCVATPGCISFNLCGSACGVSGWSMAYDRAASAACSWTRRLSPRDDSPAPRAVAWAADTPAPGTGAVTLEGGPLADAFDENTASYLRVRSPADMLFWFASRAGAAPPAGAQCFGWGGWIKGSEAGNYLMGAGSALQWKEDAALRAGVAAVVAGVRGYQARGGDGYLWAANESEMLYDNMPDYCASWITRGLIDADAAGVPDALNLARESISLFNNYSELPFILPQDGGPDYVPGAFPSGYKNGSDGGYGQPQGHLIYIE